MLNDMRRNLAFHSAITAYIAQHPNKCNVLDLGSGTGLLSLYAAAAGAAQVFAVEQDEVMFNICKNVTTKKTNIEVFHCSSIDFDLDLHQVDLVVTETLDSVGIGEGVVRYCADIATRSTNENITFMPSNLSLKGFLIQSEILELSYFSEDFKSNIGTVDQPYCCEFLDEVEDCIQLSNPITIIDVKLGDSIGKSVKVLEVPVISNGWCNGVCSYFIAHLFEKHSITSAPKFVKTKHSRMDCWEQGFHPLPKRYVKIGEIARIKVEFSDISVALSWVNGKDDSQYTIVEPRQMRYLNSSFADFSSNKLLNVIPKVLDPGGLVISDPFSHACVKSLSFHGYVIHSKKLITWSRVHPPALYLGKSEESEMISSEMDKYQTLIHENVPWSTLNHTKLSDYLTFLTISGQSNETCQSCTEFTSLGNLTPTALVFWIDIEFDCGVKISTFDEPLWRPAAIIFPRTTNVREKYKVTSLFRGASFAAFIDPA